MSQEVLTPPSSTFVRFNLDTARVEQPEIYQEGDCWRFRWAGEDRGSFDCEQDAHRAASRHKQYRLLQHFASALDRN